MTSGIVFLIACVFFVTLADGLIIQEKFHSPEPEDKVCAGTSMGFSYSGSVRRHYRYMKRRYTGCTHVEGNLEITHLTHWNIKYDLSFLRTIRYVSGYVLIAMVTEARVIPLTSLEIIRGNKTIDIFNRRFGLLVTLTSRSPKSRRGLQELQMPNLKEISRGNVMFSGNPALCYVKTILWEAIVGVGQEVDLKGEQAVATRCLPCSGYCAEDGHSRCWGRGKQLCQKVEPMICHASCPYRCFYPGKVGCCHSQCASGCWGPSEMHCEMCKDYDYEGRCVGWCPYERNTYADGQQCRKF